VPLHVLTQLPVHGSGVVDVELDVDELVELLVELLVVELVVLDVVLLVVDDDVVVEVTVVLVVLDVDVLVVELDVVVGGGVVVQSLIVTSHNALPAPVGVRHPHGAQLLINTSHAEPFHFHLQPVHGGVVVDVVLDVG
jgi:hypothetical protein